MKSATRKYWNKYESINKLENELRRHEKGLVPYNPIKRYAIEDKLKVAYKALQELGKAVTEQEFEEHLESNMCCTWEDFIGDR